MRPAVSLRRTWPELLKEKKRKAYWRITLETCSGIVVKRLYTEVQYEKWLQTYREQEALGTVKILRVEIIF